MSNTYKDKKFGYFNALAKEDWFKAWDEYEAKPKYGTLYHWNFYNKNPSWFNRLNAIKPARAKQRDLLKKIDLNNCEEYWDFPDYKKPCDYYW